MDEQQQPGPKANEFRLPDPDNDEMSDAMRFVMGFGAEYLPATVPERIDGHSKKQNRTHPPGRLPKMLATPSGNVAARAIAELKIMQPLMLALIARPPGAPPEAPQTEAEASAALNYTYTQMLNKVATEADRFLEDIGSGAEQRAPWQDAMARQEFATMVAAAWEQDQSTALTRNYSMRSTWQHTGAIRRYAGSIWDKIDTPVALGLTMGAQINALQDCYHANNLLVDAEDSVLDWAPRELYQGTQEVVQHLNSRLGPMLPASKLAITQAVVKLLGSHMCALWQAEAERLQTMLARRDEANISLLSVDNLALRRISKGMAGRVDYVANSLGSSIEKSRQLMADNPATSGG